MANQENDQNNDHDQNQEQANVDELMKLSPDEATPEQFAEMQKIAKSSFEQKSSWRSKAIDPKSGRPFKDLLAETKTQEQEESNKNEEQNDDSADQDDEIKEKLDDVVNWKAMSQFQHKNQLSPEETERTFAYAKGIGKKPEEVIEDPWFKRSLEANREAEQNAQNTPGPSSRSPKVEGKDFNEMDEKERKVNWSKITKRSK